VIARKHTSERPSAAETLRELAAFLGIHPYGRRMARLTGQPPRILRSVLYGGAASTELASRLGLLAGFMGAARDALARRALLAAEEDHRRWLREGVVETPRGSVRPIEALEDPVVVSLAIGALQAEVAATSVLQARAR
jgi:hypothetical protein